MKKETKRSQSISNDTHWKIGFYKVVDVGIDEIDEINNYFYVCLDDLNYDLYHDLYKNLEECDFYVVGKVKYDSSENIESNKRSDRSYS